MGQFEVHRARLFAFVPSGVRCLAAPPAPHRHRLAVGRLDGSLEVYDLQANSFQEKVIPGHETRIPEALCWAGEDRLFGAGLSGDVVEYDLEKLHVSYALDAFGGPIWSMASDPTGTRLAVGCEDGSIKLFLVLPERIQFERQLDRQKGRIMSLSWHPTGSKIAAGSIDFLRIFDVKSGHAVQKIQVERRLQGPHSQKCVVWGLVFLSDGTVVSTDSTGKVQFWDSEMGTLLSKHPVSKSAVLCIAVSEAEDSLVVGTSEGMVYQFQQLPVKLGSADHQWVRTRPFRFHTHDVRAVAHTATAFVSGGLDGQLVIRPLMEKVEFRSYEAVLRKVTFPHRCLVSCARKPRLLLFQYPQHLELWRLGATNATGAAGDILALSSPPEHLLQLKIKGHEHIGSSCISLCGGWIAYSTASRFCLYHLQFNGDQVAIKKVPNTPKLLRSAHHLIYSVDSTKLFVASDCGSVHVLELLQPEGCKHLHTLRPNSETREAVHLLAVSTNGKWLAAAGGDRVINIYSLKNAKFNRQKPKSDHWLINALGNTLKHMLHCTVPSYDCPVTALAIHPVTNVLVITHSDQQLFEFSIKDKEYTTWSRMVQKVGLHLEWLQRDTPITRIAFRPKHTSEILFQDTYMFCILDKSLMFLEEGKALQNQTFLAHSTEDIRLSNSHAFKICKKYQPLLFADLLDENSLVVVERFMTDIKAQLPPPVYQKKFGT